MLIKQLVNKYMQQGHNFRNAQNLAAEEIVLNKIAVSPLSEKVTLKGGIVMFNLTKSDRRVTQDIDFDLIRYSIDDYSIKLFVEKLDSVNDGITVLIDGDIEPLNQEDYQGVRVHLLLKDEKESTLKIKLDIGVHTYSAIEQEKIIFTFDSDSNSISVRVNPCEQVFAEKLISLARLGPISTRYKDLYDFYYLIVNDFVKISKIREILNLFLSTSKRMPNNMFELVNSVIDTLENPTFAKEAKEPASKWIDVEYDDLKNTIIEFIQKI